MPCFSKLLVFASSCDSLKFKMFSRDNLSQFMFADTLDLIQKTLSTIRTKIKQKYCSVEGYALHINFKNTLQMHYLTVEYETDKRSRIFEYRNNCERWHAS